MPFSHHSHSGQFCGHAEGTLEEVVKQAIEKKMETFALTEHMPREEEDFYPEEETMHTSATLRKLFDDYYHEARRLQNAYSGVIELLVGMEIDWIRPQSKEYIQTLLGNYPLDVFIGSVHHVHTIPIDFDRGTYRKAREKSGGTDERLFEDYFDLQFEMLQQTKPPIVGHFDLIRLMSDVPNASLRQWDGVWHKILRNLDFIAGYGGVIELNSAALRKGLEEPYPQSEICKEFVVRGAQFTLSDDSHGINQVGTNYGKLLSFIETTGISSVVFFKKGTKTKDHRLPGVSTATASLASFRAHSIFTST